MLNHQSPAGYETSAERLRCCVAHDAVFCGISSSLDSQTDSDSCDSE